MLATLVLSVFLCGIAWGMATSFPWAGRDTLDRLSYRKTIPPEFSEPIRTALAHFPELQRVRILFRIRRAYTPLSTKPAFWSLFKRRNHRTYLVTISSQSIDTLSHLLYRNLNFTEQVGIMGHELSHVADFNSKNLLRSAASALGHLSQRYLDRLEYRTDSICICHGLGGYLEAYSRHVRTSMHVRYWRGVDHVFQPNDHWERYMNPDTIERHMQSATACRKPD
ncbi:MAG TPA: hypothetical protein VG870_11635 [Chitinophagaceae bacterium]|nr:hypothetical protein [Chitinophagaceae bacterium]